MKHFLLAALLLSFTVTAAPATPKSTVYELLLLSQERNDIKLGAKALNHEPGQPRQTWDLAAAVFASLGEHDREEDSDTRAWLAKALGRSGQPRYLPVLVRALQKTEHGNIKKHVKRAIRQLKKGDLSQEAFEARSVDIQGRRDSLNRQLTPLRASSSSFDSIVSDASLAEVLQTLGLPNGAQDAMEVKFRPFIGNQRFQQLQINYVGIGTLRFRYDNNRWRLLEKMSQVDVDLAVSDGLKVMASRLMGRNADEVRNVAKEMYRQQLFDEGLLDLVGQRIWMDLDAKDKLTADAMAWLCKVLGHSGNGRYKQFLEKVAAQSSNRKITRYAANAAQNLPAVAESVSFKVAP
ncbi:HEAT repeat domain-containing protein [Gallaecimonas sp. GXIMD4217]|uniref:HEAT repeat domain-containing protein n=1 Tax=Gallaecimonas sp. GXIMD4217 TaxID=3131927 RepID=UPI00311ADC0F